MKTKTKIHLRITKNGKMILKTTTGKRKRIYQILQAKDDKNTTYYVKVTYPIKKYFNHGEYTNKKDAIYAIKCFTEKDLIEEFSHE